MIKQYPYGFRGQSYQLNKDYLSNRWQSVGVDERKQNLNQLQQPYLKNQSSDRFLFLAYVNDSARYSQNNNEIAIFTGETSILKTGKKGITATTRFRQD